MTEYHRGLRFNTEHSQDLIHAIRPSVMEESGWPAPQVLPHVSLDATLCACGDFQHISKQIGTMFISTVEHVHCGHDASVFGM